MAIIKNIKQLNEKINVMGKAGAIFEKLADDVAKSAVLHVHVHGDVTVLNTVVEKMPEGARTNAMKAFLEAFAPVNWNTKKKQFKFASKKQNKDFENSQEFKAMLETSWVKFKPEPTYRGLDSSKMVASLIKKLSEGSKVPEKDVINNDMLTELKAIATKYGIDFS